MRWQGLFQYRPKRAAAQTVREESPIRFIFESSRTMRPDRKGKRVGKMNMFFRDLFSTGAAPVSDALFMFIFRISGFDFTTVGNGSKAGPHIMHTLKPPFLALIRSGQLPIKQSTGIGSFIQFFFPVPMLPLTLFHIPGILS